MVRPPLPIALKNDIIFFTKNLSYESVGEIISSVKYEIIDETDDKK